MDEDEKTPVIDSEVVPHSYTDEAEEDESSLSKRLTREISIEVRQHDRLTLTWTNLSAYAVQDTRKCWHSCCPPDPNAGGEPYYKQILFNVTGTAKPGQLLGILGASGAGKSTLLNVLNQRNLGGMMVEGSLRVNGALVVNSGAMASLSGYVQQDDAFVGMLTVREHLWFHAMLRMDKELTDEERNMKIDEVIRELGLMKCANTTIGKPPRVRGISGGERKRLAVAAEVLTNPSLLFCDEPTSGLDSFMAESVVVCLKKLANGGRTVVCTLHQPSSQVFAVFDRILIIAEGRVGYLGPMSEICDFFASVGRECPPTFNPADYCIHQMAIIPGREVECRKFVHDVCDAYEASPQHEVIMSEIQAVEDAKSDEEEILLGSWKTASPYKRSWFGQFGPVFWRSWYTTIRDPAMLRGRVIHSLCISLLIGLVYLNQTYDQKGVQNINGCLFLMQVQMTFGNLFTVLNTFLEERVAFLREHHNGMYCITVYYITRMLAELPLFICLPAIFTTIIYWMVGLYPTFEAYCTCCIIMVLVANISVSFGYLLSCSADRLSVLMSITPLILVPLMLFGGFYLNSESVPVYFLWLEYLSWLSYSNECMLVNQWKDVDYLICEYNTTETSTSMCYPDGESVLTAYGYSEDHLMGDYLSLSVMLVGYRILSCLVLYLRTRKRT